MTVRMRDKHQVTIPCNIAMVLGLGNGSLLDVALKAGRIELTPVEIMEKKFTAEDYKRMEAVTAQEKGKERRLTKRRIAKMVQGKV